MRVVTKKLRLRQPTFMGLFEGVGGFSVGLEAAGWKPIAHVERDKYAQQVLRRHWPDVPLMDDVTEVTADGIAQATGGVLPDLICGGFPCFPAGTLITTKRGQVPIQEVEVGDEVLTHRNRWRRVVQHHGSHRAEVLRLKGHGQPRLDTTANHPLWSSTSEQVWNNTARRYLTPMSRPEWRRADSMLGKYWASPVVFPESKVPEVTSTDRESDLPPVNTPEFMWFVGLYLGDGWCRNDSRLVGVGVALHEEAEVRARLLATGLPFTDYRDRTTHRFQISRGSLVRWLLEHFGTGSGGKQVPAWALGMDEPLRRALVDGYRFSDGCASPGGWKATTISKSLAVTMRMLAQSLGWSVALHYSERPDTCVIEGRTVSQQNTWQLVAQERSPEGRIIDGQRFGRVRGTQPLTKMEVYNFEVEEDHSYVADGVTVKNCQDISLAGHRRGLAGERSGLWWEFHRIIDEVRPQYALIENVGGLLSSSGGRDLGAILGALGELGYGYAYRVLDSRYFGVPQRRRRVFIVASLDHWGHPGEVLLEPAGVRRDPAPSREEGEEASRAVAVGAPVQGQPRTAGGAAAQGGQESTGRAINGWSEVGSLTKSLGEGGPDAAHAFANWLVSVAKDGEQSVPTIVYNVYPVSAAIERNMLTARVTDEAEALTASFAKRSDRGDLVLQAKDLAFNQRDEPRFADDEVYALQATPGVDEQLVQTLAIPIDVFRKLHRATSKEDHETWAEGEVANTLNTYDEGDVRTTHAIVSVKMVPEDDGEAVRTILTSQGRQDLDSDTFVTVLATPGELAVRRLLPTETERLQAFPDGHTEWGRKEDGSRVEISDTQRYKMMGNALTVNVATWIGKRLYRTWLRDVL